MADFRFCSNCGEEYNAVNGPHNCDPQTLEIIALDAGWGGKRHGSGRPSKLLNPKRVTIWLEAEQVEWLSSQGDKSEVIRNLINKSKAP